MARQVCSMGSGRRPCAEQGFDFGEGLFNQRIEVWRVGGKGTSLALAARMAARTARPL